jgi:hypothetical protein
MIDERTDEWVSVPVAASRLGISESAVRSRVGRRTLRSRKDNHGTLLVRIDEVSAKHRAFVGEASVGIPEPLQTRQDTPETVPLSAHREIVQALQAALERQEVAFRDQIARERAQHRETVEMWREWSDMAEIRAEQANDMVRALTEKIMAQPAVPAARPWWARWWRSAD